MPAKKLEEEKELFYEFLHRNGLKKTHQKELILETFLGNEGHMSVEDIYALVKKKDKKVGIVTVFRTLKSLTACGIAKEITLGDGLTRFEHCYHHPLHHHIVCTECHKVIEFLSPELESVQQAIVTKYHFRPLHQRIQIYGICRNCREQRPASDQPKPDTGKVFARDALKMALAVQKQGVEFYRSAAVQNRDPAGREVFETMVREEESYARELESKLNMMNRHEKGLEDAPIFLHFDPCELQQLVPCVQANLIEGELRMDARSALEIAMKLEKCAAGFFKEYAEKFDDTEGKRIFQRHAEQGMNRCAAIRRRAEAMVAAPG
jgi:Fur family ferric uptake transcriptional regulator